MDWDPALVDFLVDEMHARHGVPLLPCHPRDLLGLALDYTRYTGAAAVDEAALRWAWANYFVAPGAAGTGTEKEASPLAPVRGKGQVRGGLRCLECSIPSPQPLSRRARGRFGIGYGTCSNSPLAPARGRGPG